MTKNKANNFTGPRCSSATFSGKTQGKRIKDNAGSDKIKKLEKMENCDIPPGTVIELSDTEDSIPPTVPKISNIIRFQATSTPASDMPSPSPVIIRMDEEPQGEEESDLFDCNSPALFNLLNYDYAFFQNSCRKEEENLDFHKQAVPVKLEIETGSQVIVSHSNLEADLAYHRLLLNGNRDPSLRSKINQANKESVNVTLQIFGTVMSAAADELEMSSSGETLVIDANKLLQSTFMQTSVPSVYYGSPFPIFVQKPLDCQTKVEQPVLTIQQFWAQINDQADDEEKWLKMSEGSHLYYGDARSLKPDTQITTFIMDELTKDIYRLSGHLWLCGYTLSLTQLYFTSQELKSATKTSRSRAKKSKPPDTFSKDSHDVTNLATDFKNENPHAKVVVFPLIVGNHYIVVAFTIETGAIKVYDPLETHGTPVTNHKLKQVLKKIKKFLQSVYDSSKDEDKWMHLVYTQEAGLPVQAEDDGSNCGIFCLLFLEYLSQSSFWKTNIAPVPLPTKIKHFQVEGELKQGFFKEDYVPPPKKLNPLSDKRFKNNKTLLQISSLNFDEIRKQYFTRLLSLGTVVN